MYKNFDNISYSSEMVDITEYKLKIEFGSKPIPDQLVIGKLPRKYNNQIFLNKVKRIFNKQEGEYTTTEENFNFVLWFLTRARKKQKLEYINEFVFSLRGIGLLVDEQRYWLKKLGFDEEIINKLWFKMPVEDFYPEILPLELYELVRRIPEINSKITFKNHTKKAAQIVSFIYQSMRINYEYGKDIGNFSFTGFTTLVKISRSYVGNYLNLLEKYKLIVCIKHGILTSNITGFENFKLNNNNYSIPSYNHIFHPYPLINIIQYYKHQNNNKFPIDINKFSETDFFNIADYSKLLFGEKEKIPFIKDSFQRRSNSSFLYKKFGLNVFLSIGKSNNSAKQLSPETWHVFKNSQHEIENVKNIIERKAPNINVDKQKINQYLFKMFKLKNDEDEVVTHNLGKINQTIKMLEMMKDRGIADNYELCKTGRLKSSQYTNPLNTSKDEGKYGYELWDCIHEALYEVDINAADVISAAMISGDKKMFDDYFKDGFYINNLRKMKLEDTETNRKLIKRIQLIIQNGGGSKNTYDKKVKDLINKDGWDNLFEKYKVFFRKRYTVFCSKSEGWKDKGIILKYRREHEPLPNELPLIINKIFAVTAHIIQAVTKIIITRLFTALEFHQYDCIFEIHDAVIMRKKVDKEFANNLMRTIISSILKELNLKWKIPLNANFVKVEKIFSENKAA